VLVDESVATRVMSPPLGIFPLDIFSDHELIY
jgi:hypothetical protein